MNRSRRKTIAGIGEDLERLADSIDDVRQDEDDARDNMPENLEGSDAYQQSEECSDTLDEAASAVRDVVALLHELP